MECKGCDLAEFCCELRVNCRSLCIFSSQGPPLFFYLLEEAHHCFYEFRREDGKHNGMKGMPGFYGKRPAEKFNGSLT